jgi:hypothetical protein
VSTEVELAHQVVGTARTWHRPLVDAGQLGAQLLGRHLAA